MQEVKGDIVNLYFLDRLLDDLKVLDDTANPKIKVIWESVAEELFPILGAISKPGMAGSRLAGLLPIHHGDSRCDPERPEAGNPGREHLHAPRRQRWNSASKHAGQSARYDSTG